MRFGEYVAQRRKQLGLSQKELASRILKEDGAPISPQYLNDIEHGRRNPPGEDLLRQFSSELEISHEYLNFLAGDLPADLRGLEREPEVVEAAFKAFRRKLEG